MIQVVDNRSKKEREKKRWSGKKGGWDSAKSCTFTKQSGFRIEIACRTEVEEQYAHTDE